MKKEDAFSADFLKQFKTGEELNSFLNAIRKRGIEQLLEGELDNHLGYEKHERSDSNNSRNGKKSKKVKTSDGELQIDIPRDRNGSFNPLLIPKRKSMVDGLENIVVSL
jgi:transposase-like protein